ncbi:hypothetical protein [Streptomyces sp. NPDC056682]|uniref:hypothetical protein n=1 Tax=Streptomyces sp. NPDC056682 TaxID=3345909 RepID=UPI0036754DAF
MGERGEARHAVSARGVCFIDPPTASTPRARPGVTGTRAAATETTRPERLRIDGARFGARASTARR